MSSSRAFADSNLGYQLRRVQLGYRRCMDAALRPLGITTPQYSVLATLASEPGASNADLARSALVTAQSMQGLVANLERLGLIVRKQDPDHGRILQAQVTARGQSVLTKGHKIAAEIDQAMISGVDPGDIGKVSRLLGSFADNLNASGR